MNLKIYSFALILMIITVYANAQVAVTRDIDYIPNSVYEDGRDLLDIYMPEGVNDAPVIVYFHGGGLLRRDKSAGKNIGYQVAKSGIGLISANYRLSPDFHHPDHVQDAAAATEWAINNIKEYGGNPEKVYVGGHSAGAYLAALLAIDPSILKLNEIENSQIAGAVLLSPFLFVEETAKVRIERDSIYKSIWGNDPHSWLKASVTPHIGPNRDNILLIYADGDEAWRKDQNERFARAMLDAGNHRIFIYEVSNRTHGSLISAIQDNDDMIVNLICDFVLNK
jgi:acetyl esterase/lipase